MIIFFKKAPRRESVGDGIVAPNANVHVIFLLADAPWDYSEVD